MIGLIVLLILISVYATVMTSLWLSARNDKDSENENEQTSTMISDTGASESVSNAPRIYSDDEYQIKADEAMHLSDTFQKFVPRQFVEHFAKHGNSDLALGTADEDTVAILFCDIRGFTGLSERMSPQELMNFLNSYFLRMNAPIHTNHGFIDKFIGDAIMALFDRPKGSDSDKAQDAIKAAIGLRKALQLYNQHRAKSDYQAIEIGIGVHFGPVILGTVGSDDRMDTTVIGDSVNIAQRLETLAPVYGVDIVTSRHLIETAFADDKDAATLFKCRVIDWVRVKGRTNPIELIEIIEHLPKQQQASKMANQGLIEQVISLRKEKRFDHALALLKQAPFIGGEHNDPLISHHIKSIEHLILNGVSPKWDGAVIN